MNWLEKLLGLRVAKPLEVREIEYARERLAYMQKRIADLTQPHTDPTDRRTRKTA